MATIATTLLYTEVCYKASRGSKLNWAPIEAGGEEVDEGIDSTWWVGVRGQKKIPKRGIRRMECVSYEEDTDPRYKLKLREVEDPRRVSFVAAGAKHHQERASVRQRQYENAVYQMYEIYENAVYKNTTRCTRTLQGVLGGPTTMRSMRWKVFTSWKVIGTARFSQRSQKPATCRRSVSLVQRAPWSLHLQFDPSGSWLVPLSRLDNNLLPPTPYLRWLYRLDPRWLDSSKIRLLVARTDEGLPLICNQYDDNLSEGSPVINDTDDWLSTYQRYVIVACSSVMASTVIVLINACRGRGGGLRLE